MEFEYCDIHDVVYNPKVGCEGCQDDRADDQVDQYKEEN